MKLQSVKDTRPAKDLNFVCTNCRFLKQITEICIYLFKHKAILYTENPLTIVLISSSAQISGV